MNKRELIEKLAPLSDDAEILLAIITPKDENDSFEMGSSEGAEPDEDDDTIDNGDGTVTNLESIDDVQILENEDPDNNNEKEKFAAIVIDMCDEEEDDEPGEGESDPVTA